MIESWILSKIEPHQKEPLIILRDPQRMIQPGARAVDGWAEENNFVVPFCSGNMALREMIEFSRVDPDLRYLVVDRSREDAKIPLYYPDLEAAAPARCRLQLTLRDFLVEKTGDSGWPQLVNERRLSRVILENLDDTQRAHQNLRQIHPTRFTDSDCYKIILGGALKINPFRHLTPSELRCLCIERHHTIEQLTPLLPEDVIATLHETIQRAEKPFCWLLERDATQVMRAFTLAAILHQHNLEYQVLISNLDPNLHDYREIEPDFLEQAMHDQLTADPDQVLADVKDVEDFLLDDPQRLSFLMHDRLAVEESQNAKRVLENERLSTLIRGIALVSLLTDLIDKRSLKFHQGVLLMLDEQQSEGTNLPAISRPTAQWQALVDTYRRALDVYQLTNKLAKYIKEYKVVQAEELVFEDFDNLWNGEGLNRLDFYLADLNRMLRVGDMLPTPQKDFWPSLENRWNSAREKLDEVITIARRAIDLIDRKFQDFYRLHYTKWIRQDDSPVIFTHQFLSRLLQPYWDPQSGRKTVVLVFDGMRTDAWDEFLRPVLEERFEVIHSSPGSALLPTETNLTRKAISAGCLPEDFSSTREITLLQDWLTNHMNLEINLDVVHDDDTEDAGMTVRYVSDQLEYIIFNFTDHNLHHNTQDLSLIYNTTVREIIRQDVRSVLRELPDDVMLFITSDHGFLQMPKSTYRPSEDIVTDVYDIKYRNARVLQKPEGEGVKKTVEFDARVLGIPQDSPNARGTSFNYVLFPRPGLIFQRPHGRHDPDRYSHGGLSMAECFVPMVVLGPRQVQQYPLCIESLQQIGSVSEEERSTLEIVLLPTSIGLEDLAITISFSEADIPTRREVFSGKKTTYTVNWTPTLPELPEGERTLTELVFPVTAIVSFKQTGEIVRLSKTTDVRVKLEPNRLRRRVDSKLDLLMGKVPDGMRE